MDKERREVEGTREVGLEGIGLVGVGGDFEIWKN